MTAVAHPLAHVIGKPVLDEYIELRRLRFHYRDWAAAPTPRQTEAPTLLLLHGYTGHARSWDYVAAALTDRFRVIALDQRGHGETGWAPADHYGTAEMVADLRAFVAALGLRNYALCGLSMGGIVAFHYAGGSDHADGAGQVPDELARLVIVDIAPELITAGSARIADGAVARDVFASKEEAIAQQRASNSRAPDAHLRYRVENNLMRLADGRWTWRYDRALRDVRALRSAGPEAGWRAVAAIGVPTLLIRGGESDLLAPDVAERMAALIPDGRLSTIAGSGHSVPLDAPDAFVAALRDFLPG